MAIDPIILSQLIKTPDGMAAAAIQLAQMGIEPEELETELAKAAAGEPPAPDVLKLNPQLAAQSGEAPGASAGQRGGNMSQSFDLASIFGGGGGAVNPALSQANTPTAPNAGLGTSAPSVNPANLLMALQSVQALQPQASPVGQPAGIAPGGGSVGGLNAGSTADLIRLALLGQGGTPGAQAPVPTLGQLLGGGFR